MASRILSLLVLAFSAGCVPVPGPDFIPPRPTAAAPVLKVDQFVVEPYIPGTLPCTFRGTVVNPGPAPVEWASLEFEVLDAQGRFLEPVFCQVVALRPGSRAAFAGWTSTFAPARVRLLRITAL